MQLDPAIYKQTTFTPPFCPNEKCHLHQIKDQGREARFYRRNGWARTKRAPGMVRLYQCKRCNRAFRYSCFKLEYRQKLAGLNHKILDLILVGASNREVARRLGCSEHLVRGRVDKMSKQILLRHSEFLSKLKIAEGIVYDGLENFAGSQYDPCQINQALGKDSLFIYDFNFAPLNRKGKMSHFQKVRKKELEEFLGRYDKKATRVASAEIFARLYEMRADKNAALLLFTDKHFHYRQAVQEDLRDYKILHHTTSSKDFRNYQNNLFAVNHSDILIRHHIRAFTRETIAFAKKPAAMIQKFILFMGMMNYMRPQFVKEHKTRPKAHTHTPAMMLGLTNRPLRFHELFDLRRTPTQVPLNREWALFFNNLPTFNRQVAA